MSIIPKPGIAPEVIAKNSLELDDLYIDYIEKKYLTSGERFEREVFGDFVFRFSDKQKIRKEIDRKKLNFTEERSRVISKMRSLKWNPRLQNQWWRENHYNFERTLIWCLYKRIVERFYDHKEFDNISILVWPAVGGTNFDEFFGIDGFFQCVYTKRIQTGSLKKTNFFFDFDVSTVEKPDKAPGIAVWNRKHFSEPKHLDAVVNEIYLYFNRMIRISKGKL